MSALSSHRTGSLPRRSFLGWTAAAVALAGSAGSPFAQELVPIEDPAIPKALTASHFEAVLGNSPFLRTLSLTETFALRGIAEIDGEQVATLFNRETEKSVLVSASKANPEQMKLLAVNGDPGALAGMDSVSATIAVAGEQVELKFEPNRIAPRPGNSKGSSGGPGGKPGESKGESERRGPSKEDMDRYNSLSDEQKSKFRDYMRQTMQKYPDMSREERGNMIRGALTRLADGRDISAGSNAGSDSSGGNGGGGGDRRGGGGDRR